MNITLNIKLGRFKAKLFSLCCLNINKMAWIFFFALVCEQLISAAIEIAIWGERFAHYGDVIALIFFPTAFLYYANELGEFLLKLMTESEVEE